jgi:hypothetical protein
MPGLLPIPLILPRTVLLALNMPMAVYKSSYQHITIVTQGIVSYCNAVIVFKPKNVFYLMGFCSEGDWKSTITILLKTHEPVLLI